MTTSAPSALWDSIHVESDPFEGGDALDRSCAVDGGEDELQPGCFCDHLLVENKCFKTSEVGVVVGLAQRDDLTLRCCWLGLEVGSGESIDLVDDARGVGFDDLGSLVEVDLVAVVVRRVVACGDDDA